MQCEILLKGMMLLLLPEELTNAPPQGRGFLTNSPPPGPTRSQIPDNYHNYSNHNKIQYYTL